MPALEPKRDYFSLYFHVKVFRDFYRKIQLILIDYQLVIDFFKITDHCFFLIMKGSRFNEEMNIFFPKEEEDDDRAKKVCSRSLSRSRSMGIIVIFTATLAV